MTPRINYYKIDRIVSRPQPTGRDWDWLCVLAYLSVMVVLSVTFCLWVLQ